MGSGECLSCILSRLNLDDIEETVQEPYHRTGPGKPPRKPLKQLMPLPSTEETVFPILDQPPDF